MKLKMLAPWRKAMTNLHIVLQSRGITLPTKVWIVKAMVFPEAMHWCESWTIKAERQRIHTFELWCWRRLLRIHCIARRPNQLILKEINPEYSLEGLMLKLKLQYFGHLMRRANSLVKTLKLAKIEAGGKGDERGQDGWMASPTNWIWVWASSRRSLVKDREAWCAADMGSQRVGPWRLSCEELMLLNCGVGEDSWESLGLQEDQVSQS